jgi:hypothetical protein
MPAQSRRPATRPSRAQRRAAAQGARTYNAPAASAQGARTYDAPASIPAARTYNVPAGRVAPARPRRIFSGEPPPVDYSEEFGFIRKDLRRIIMWAGVILLTMIALSFVFPLLLPGVAR